MALNHGESGPGGGYPEQNFPDVVLNGYSPDLKTAAVIGGAVATAMIWRLRTR
jgi:hypothetical protein